MPFNLPLSGLQKVSGAQEFRDIYVPDANTMVNPQQAQPTLLWTPQQALGTSLVPQEFIEALQEIAEQQEPEEPEEPINDDMPKSRMI